jgi:hypothetical protein
MKLGLPVEIEDEQLVLVTGGLYGAVTMPAALGELVRAQLQLLTGPVLAWAVPGQQELWTFLVRAIGFPQKTCISGADQHRRRHLPSRNYAAFAEPSRDWR